MARGGDTWALHLGWLAGVLFGASVWASTLASAKFDPAHQAVGLLGSALAPHALAFNLVGFLLPGLCVAGLALALDRPLRSIVHRKGDVAPRAAVGRSGRLATHLLLISGLALAALGLLPFDPHDVDGAQSRRHVFAYTIALLAWMPSTLLLSLALRGRRAWRPLPALGIAFAAALLACLVWPADQWLPGWSGKAGYAQRLMFALYFAWFAIVAIVALRSARRGDA